MSNQIGRQCRQSIVAALRQAKFNRQVLAFRVAGFGKPLTERA
jgi:hypothetical protein